MMSSTYLRAIRGPVLLIVLGVLMLADQQGGVSFWNTWPLLLVTGGLLVLAERMAVRENPWAAPQAGGAYAPPPTPAPPPSPAPPTPQSIYRRFGEHDEQGAAGGATTPPPASTDRKEEGGPQL